MGPEGKPYEDNCKDSGARQEFGTGAVRDIQEGKGRFDLISPVGERRLARRYEQGAVKYGPNNWQKGIPVSRCIESAKRHICGYLEGDTSEDHLAAAAWNLFTAMHMEIKRPEMQDVITRPDFHYDWEHIWAEEVENRRRVNNVAACCDNSADKVIAPDKE